MHSLMLWCVTGDFSACLASFWGCGVILLCLNFSFDCCGVSIVLLCGYILFVPFVVWSWDARNLRHFWSFCGTLLHIYTCARQIVDQVKEPSFPSRMPISTAAAAADAGNHHYKGYSTHPAVLTAPLCLSLLSSNLSVYQ